MLFGKRKKKKEKCENCNSSLDKKFTFCPYCGKPAFDQQKEKEDFGLLGKSDNNFFNDSEESFGLTDRFIGSLMNNLVKTLDRQFKNFDKEIKNTEVRTLPNGFKIRIGPQRNVRKKNNSMLNKELTSSQIKKMSTMPREEAKTSVKRLSDKIIYELKTPGIESEEDVFISKLESGYEIKVIGNKKIYVNSLPLNLPLKQMFVDKNKILIEFKSQ